MKKILFQGAFDIINYGHVKAIEDARKQGDYLIIALNTDELILVYKSREAILPYAHRKAILEALKWVDEVIPADAFSPLELLKKLSIDIYVCAEEWSHSKSEEIEYMKKKGGSVFYTPEYESVIRSTEIRERCYKQVKAQKGL